MKNALYIQSGGPTAVINASAYGVYAACREHSSEIGRLYAARYGTMGLLENQLIDVSAQDPEQLAMLTQTPSSAFGSCRYRIPDGTEGDEDYDKILHTLRKADIGYIFYNGGNGTLRACKALSDRLAAAQFPCKVVAIPKTVDNDIHGIDHAPGFPSAARHVAITVAQLHHDMNVYNTNLIMVLEVMGRNSGWLAGASALAAKEGHGPDLIYFPEYEFNPEKFLQDVKAVYAQKGRCLAVVSEGVKTSEDKYLFEYQSKTYNDAPALNMGGVTPYLTNLLGQHFDCKIRGIDLGLMQRCSRYDASDIDVKEAELLGRNAVEAALAGHSNVMTALQRLPGKEYSTKPILLPLEQVTQLDGHMPLSYINATRNYVEPAFYEYLAPLVGELPAYARLNTQID